MGIVLCYCFALTGIHAAGGREPAAGAPRVTNPRMRLATTTSTENSGLLADILPRFSADTGYIVDVVAVGTGAALKLGENADVDIVLVHARSLEAAFMAAGHGAERRDVMYNDFIILGPAKDPAGLGWLNDAVQAFQAIASGGHGFVSRGDNSGTHVMERSLWQAIDTEPTGSWYKEAGQGMEQVLIMADSLAAYTLADRSTWLAVGGRTDLVICFEGDPRLFNPYGIISVNPDKHPGINAAGARALLDWLTSEKGQATINDFKCNGEQLFFANYRSEQGYD